MLGLCFGEALENRRLNREVVLYFLNLRLPSYLVSLNLAIDLIDTTPTSTPQNTLSLNLELP